MGITLTNEEFQEKFYNKFDKNEYTLISQYTGGSNFIRIRHKCGYELDTNADMNLRKSLKI